MSDWVAYVNGAFVPAETAGLSIYDRGLRWGDAVYEVERTFRHEVFRLRDHMERLARSLRYARIQPRQSMAEMEAAVRELVRRNSPRIAPECDVDVVQVITRGTVMAPDKPNVVMYCQEIEWGETARALQEGVRLVTASTRRIPPQCLSPNAKIANKMSQMVAEREAKAADPEARALMLDIYGYIAEDTSANIFFAAGERLFTPSLANCLPGISRKVTLELAAKLGIAAEEGSHTLFELYHADEAFLTSTSPCLYGVTQVDGVRIGASFPGPMTRRLTEGWKELAGLDFVAQAVREAQKTRG